MKKNMIKKKLLIPCIAAACMMYGCSSQPSSPAVSTETLTADESDAGAGEGDASGGSETNAAADTETTAADSSAKSGDNSSSEAESSETGEENTEESAEKSSDENTEDETEDKDKDNEDKDKTKENEAGAAFIKTVKEAQPKNFPGCTYGAAFDEFFTSPQWEYFTSTDGQDVVEFTGECMYTGARTKARMQFVVGKDGVTVNTGALYYNSTPQTKKIIDDSLIKIFEQYAKAHGIPYTLPAPSQPESAAAGTQPQSTAPGAAANTLPPESAALPGSTPGLVSPDAPADSAVNSSGAQAALSFAAWTNPNIGSWYSPTTGYYVIPFVDNAGNASISFAKENTRAAYAAVYYTDAVSAVVNDAGGLTYQGYIYTASSEQPALIGMVEVSWNSAAELKSLSVKMINGNQTMDTSMNASDYAYYGAVN